MTSSRSLAEPAKLIWAEASLPVTLAAGTVHVWAWDFKGADGGPAQEDVCVLSEYERKRTARYHFAADQVRYARSHANLRRVLGSYLRRNPESLVFYEASGGKPYLAGAESEANISFNLSHSRSVALLVIAIDMELGVDVEDIRPIEAGVAARFFSPAEVASLSDLSGTEWLAGFYRCWTRKESILKAEGEGLRIPLDSFDVSLRADEAAKLLAARPEARLTKEWQLHHLAPADGIIGALALPISGSDVHCFALA